MSRNTVDFDDLLASLDDLTTTSEPPPHHNDYQQHDDFQHHEEHHDDHHHHKRKDSSSSSSSSDDDDHKKGSHLDVDLSFGGGGHHAPPPPPAAAPPPPAPVFKAKVQAAPPKVQAAPAKKHAAAAPVVAKAAPKPLHVQAVPPKHQAQHQTQHHENKSPMPATGDLRNFSRQSQMVSPGGRGGSSNDKCHKCGDKFDGDYVTALNKAFHQHHFTCHDCGTQLHGNFYEHHGNTICERCAGNLLPCTKCRRGITGQYVIQDGHPHHKECVEKWNCAKCHRDVEDVVTNALGKHWHKHCFVCQKCNVQLSGSFVNENGFPTCQNCATKSLPKCSVCSRELVGDYTSFDGKGFHNECFKCQKCHVKLQLSGFYNVNGQHVCERCAHAR